ncbi:MAG: O-antigen ligase family protein, partial [Candidatus Omnitrophica bacterium]|nr:O-antigen ligase family protein [Candidatus Omnitrophota bacterium]
AGAGPGRLRRDILLLSGLPVLMLCTCRHSVNVHVSFQESVRFFVFYFAVVGVGALDKPRRTLLIWVIVLSAAGIAVRALYQYGYGLKFMSGHFTRDEIMRDGFYAWELLRQQRAVSWFSTPGLLAGYLITVIPPAAGFAVNNFREQKKAAAVIVCLLLSVMLAALFITKTIAAYLSLLIIAGLCRHWYVRGERVKKFRGLIIAGCLACAVVGTGLAMQRADAFINTRNRENSIVQRWHYWMSSLAMIRSAPLTGIGAGNFGVVYPYYKDPAANETQYAHNLWLQLGAESGMFTLVFFILYVRYIGKKWHRRRENSLEEGMLWGAGAFLLYNTFDYGFSVSQSAWSWWILLGVLAAEAADSPPAEDDCVGSRQNKAGKYGILSLIFMLIVCTLVSLVSRKLVDRGVDYYSAGKYDRAIAALTAAESWTPDDDMIGLSRARIFRKVSGENFSPRAADCYQRAIALNPRYAFTYFELGNYYWRHGRREAALRNLRLAVRYYPANVLFQDTLRRALQAR